MFHETLWRWLRAKQPCFSVFTTEELRLLRALRYVGYQFAKNTDLREAISKNAEAAAAIKEVGFTPETVTAAQAVYCLNLQGPQKEQSPLREILDTVGYPVITYDIVEGFQGLANGALLPSNNGASVLFSALGSDAPLPARCLVVVKDFYGILNSQEQPMARRALRNLFESHDLVSDKRARHVFFVQTYCTWHRDIQHCLVHLDFPLPDSNEILAEVDAMRNMFKDPQKRECGQDTLAAIVRSLKGLSASSISTVLACAYNTPRTPSAGSFFDPVSADFVRFSPDIVPLIRKHRADQLSQMQGVTVLSPDDDRLTASGTELGGYEQLRKVADEIRLCSTVEAQQAGLPPPKGLVLAGAPGCGKSHATKLFAYWLGLPCVQIDMGMLKGGYVGDSERNMHAALCAVRALGKCVVVFDEWDKQAGGIVGGYSDGNTSSNMLSQVLAFAEDPRREAFLIIAMNRMNVPIESLRCGRTDYFFYVSLPCEREREDILKIKLAENGVDKLPPLKKVVGELTEGYSGAELTAMVQIACRDAYARGGRKEPTVDDLIAAKERVTPVGRLNPADMAAMDNYKKFAVNVSNQAVKRRASARPISSLDNLLDN